MKNVLTLLLLVNGAASILYFILGVSGSDDGQLLVALGHLAVASILFFPVLSRQQISPFEPYSLFILYVIVGTLGTSYIIGFGEESHRRNVIMHGDSIGFFLPWTICLDVALLLVGLGYTAAGNRRLPVERLLPNDSRFNTNGLHLTAFLTFAVSLIATMLFIQSTGGFSFAELSRKRAIEIESGGEIVFGNAGYLRLAAGLSMTMLYVMLANYLNSPYRMKLGPRLVVLALFMLSIALPFLSSSRATIIYTLLGFILVYAVYRKVSIAFISVIVVASLIFFSAMTGLRAVAQRGEEQVFVNPIAALAESGNGMSLNGTAHILEGVPDRMDFKLGSSYLTWITAPIPRSLWPGKPDVSMGKEIKGKVFGEVVLKSGRPPSILTEGYINFNWVGFFGIALVFGFVLRLAATSFLPVLRNSIFAVTIYFPVILHLAASANGAASQIIVRLLSDILPVYLIFLAAQLLSFRAGGRLARQPRVAPLRVRGTMRPDAH